MKGICIILTLIAGKADVCQELFFKEVDSFSPVICYPDGVKDFHSCLSSKSKHLENWRIVVDKVNSWNFLSSEYKAMPR